MYLFFAYAKLAVSCDLTFLQQGLFEMPKLSRTLPFQDFSAFLTSAS